MPRIPTRDQLGEIRFGGGKVTPAQINENVAYDIGRAGAAWERAFSSIAGAFAQLGEKQQATDDANWLSQAKLQTLQNDDRIRRETDLNAGADGSGYEQAPMQFRSAVEEVEKTPGGSQDARNKYKLWSAEQGYNIGKWAVDTSQKRLKTFTEGTLDKRRDEYVNLTTQNPDKAGEYISAYEEEVNSRVGIAINRPDADARINEFRRDVLKTSILEKGKRNPADLGKAMRALGDQGIGRENVNTELRPYQAGQEDARPTSDQPVPTGSGKSGVPDPLTFIKGQEGFAPTAKWDKRQYSGGYGSKAAQGEEFTREKAEEYLRRDAKPATDWVNEHVPNATAGQRTALISFGYNLGTGKLDNLLPDIEKGDWDRVGQRMLSYNKAKNDDTGELETLPGLQRRRQEEAALFSDKSPGTRNQSQSPTEGARIGVDPKNLPTVDGTIQPSELLQLDPESYRRVTRELSPFMAEEFKTKMDNAMSSLASKGTQSIVSPEDLKNYEPFLGPKITAQYAKALDDAGETYRVQQAATKMSPSERVEMLQRLAPTGRPEDLAGSERERFDRWATAIKNINQQVTKDGYQYFTIQNEAGRAAADQIAKSKPGKDGLPQREAAFSTLIELQKKEGLSGGQVHILSKPQAEGIAREFNEAKTGPARVALLEQLRSTYGKHMDQVYVELADNGAPRTLRTLTTASRNGQDMLVQVDAFEKVARSTNDKDNKNYLFERAGVKVQDFQKAVTAETSEFVSALQRGFSPDLGEQYRLGVERIALGNMIFSGMSMSDAIHQAARDLYKDGTNVVNGAILPNQVYQQMGGGIDKAMKYGAPFLLKGYEEQIAPPIWVNKRYGSDEAWRRYIDSIQTRPYWTTKEDGTGLYMLDEYMNPVLIDTADGVVPLSYTWDQLNGIRYPVNYQRNPLGIIP